MTAFSISLGTEERVKLLFSYPNIEDSKESLPGTILHWFNQTLERDGLKAAGATASVRTEGSTYFLDLEGPAKLQGDFQEYGKRLPQFLDNGWEALNTVIPKLKAEGKWNPDPTEKGDIWRFFLPFGVAMLKQRSLQFFHYPPIRLLNPMRDYLDDPVPKRWEELLAANHISTEQEAWLYETVMDATPIAAPDDQGSKKSKKGDPKWGLMPIQDFSEYQEAQVKLLLNDSPDHPGYTIPIAVYGSHPREIFANLFLNKDDLKVNEAATAEIVPGKKTPVLGINHPYRFYAQAQIDDKNPKEGYVGSGRIVPKNCDGVVKVMKADLAAARWQVLMAHNPARDPQAVIEECEKYWKDPAQHPKVCQLVQHQGSLLYPDPKSLKFTFRLSLRDAAEVCVKNNNDPCACLD